MAADGGLAAPPVPSGVRDAWDEASRDPAAAALREKAERDAAAQAARVEDLTVGGVIDDVLEVILQAEADGIPYGEIQAFLDDYLQGRWGDAASPLLQTIFRTNAQTAFNSLRYLRMSADTEVRPFWQFLAIRDERTTSVCRTADRTLRRHDDQFWEDHWPPLHFNCRSTVIALTDAEAASVGDSPPPRRVLPPSDGFGRRPDLDPLSGGFKSPPPPPPRGPGGPPPGDDGSGDDDGEKRRRNDQLLRKRMGLPEGTQVSEDRQYTTSRHTTEGAHARRDQAKGGEAHVFFPGLDLDEVARRTISAGEDAGVVRGWHRIVIRFDEPVGVRIQDGRPGVPCYYAEVKARRLADGRWEYHLVPRVSPP